MLLASALQVILLHIHGHAPDILAFGCLGSGLQLLVLYHAQTLVSSSIRIINSFTIIDILYLDALESGLFGCYEELALEIVLLLWRPGSQSELQELVGPPGFNVLLIKQVKK